jgi:hypothetical protein
MFHSLWTGKTYRSYGVDKNLYLQSVLIVNLFVYIFNSGILYV